MKIAVIDKSRAEDIAKLAICLTTEIMERTGFQHFEVDLPKAIKLCQSYIDKGKYTVVSAFDQQNIVGFGSLCESHSLYAEGSFGIIQEFYVLPEYRSKNVGSQLLDEIARIANSNGWQRLELCTPPVPEFQRTVEFYQANGFDITGGYKMKRQIRQ
ncbi:MAG: GNAT family N-acetyltransferase [Pseudomonadales bacterium]|nr:GNAT family N-acetyltransferase [Pseudomonadales bacterium]